MRAHHATRTGDEDRERRARRRRQPLDGRHANTVRPDLEIIQPVLAARVRADELLVTVHVVEHHARGRAGRRVSPEASAIRVHRVAVARREPTRQRWDGARSFRRPVGLPNSWSVLIGFDRSCGGPGDLCPCRDGARTGRAARHVCGNVIARAHLHAKVDPAPHHHKPPGLCPDVAEICAARKIYAPERRVRIAAALGASTARDGGIEKCRAKE